MDRKGIGNKIALLRKERQLTQKQLADKINVTDKAVSKWERGLNYPDIEIMESLAGVFGISMVELLGMQNTPSEEIIKEISSISADQRKSIKKELILQSVLTIFIGILILGSQFIAAWEFHIRGIEGGISGMVTLGMFGFTGIIIGNSINLIAKIRKI